MRAFMFCCTQWQIRTLFKCNHTATTSVSELTFLRCLAVWLQYLLPVYFQILYILHCIHSVSHGFFFLFCLLLLLREKSDLILMKSVHCGRYTPYIGITLYKNWCPYYRCCHLRWWRNFKQKKMSFVVSLLCLASNK